MHILTIEFKSKTEDPEEVLKAHQPIIEAFMAHDACLGIQIMKSKSRKEPFRFMLQTAWRNKEEATEVSSKPEVMKAHDRIYDAQTGEQIFSVWNPIVQRGLFAAEDISGRLAASHEEAVAGRKFA